MESKAADNEPRTDHDDRLALMEASRGNLPYFDAFVNRHKNNMLDYVSRRITDIHRAEDITQEVFLRAFRAARRGDYKGGPNASPWLFAISRNCVTDYLRDCGASEVTYRNDLDRTCHTEQAESISDQKKAHGDVESILQLLPEAQREVLELKIFGEMTFSEISEALGTKLPTVKSRMRYAVEKIRELLLEAGSAPNG